MHFPSFALLSSTLIVSCLEVPKTSKEEGPLLSSNPLPSYRPTTQHSTYATAAQQATMEGLIATFAHASNFYTICHDKEIRVSDFNNSQNFDMTRPLPVHQWAGVHVDQGVVNRVIWPKMKLGGTFDFRRMPNTLETLYIDKNDFEGVFETRYIPKPMGFMTLEGNFFTGTIDWQNLPGALTWLDVRNNRLTGIMDLRTIPETLESVYIRGNNIRVIRGFSQESWAGDLDQSYVTGDESFVAQGTAKRFIEELEPEVKIDGPKAANRAVVHEKEEEEDEEIDLVEEFEEDRSVLEESFVEKAEDCSDAEKAVEEAASADWGEWYIRLAQYATYAVAWGLMFVLGNVFVL